MDHHPTGYEPDRGIMPAQQSRSWLATRIRQARNPPPPVLRAVLANVVVAVMGGVLLLLYELAVSRGTAVPDGDHRSAAAVAYVAAVLIAGSTLTYLWVALPTADPDVRRRSPWAALLGLFAALPICYLALVIIFQVIRPALG